MHLYISGALDGTDVLVVLFTLHKDSVELHIVLLTGSDEFGRRYGVASPPFKRVMTRDLARMELVIIAALDAIRGPRSSVAIGSLPADLAVES